MGKPSEFGGDVVREVDELGDGELFGTEGKERRVKSEEWRVRREELTEGDAEHLAALVEGGLDDALEEYFVAAEVSYGIAGHADDGTLYLGRRIEYAGLDGKEVLDVVPGLNQYGKDAVLLVARLGGHADGHLVLDHTCTAGDEVLVVEHLEEDLRRDVVGVVAREHELLAVEDLA